jgi:hypothetical protein
VGTTSTCCGRAGDSLAGVEGHNQNGAIEAVVFDAVASWQYSRDGDDKILAQTLITQYGHSVDSGQRCRSPACEVLVRKRDGLPQSPDLNSALKASEEGFVPMREVVCSYVLTHDSHSLPLLGRIHCHRAPERRLQPV